MLTQVEHEAHHCTLQPHLLLLLKSVNLIYLCLAWKQTPKHCP